MSDRYYPKWNNNPPACSPTDDSESARRDRYFRGLDSSVRSEITQMLRNTHGSSYAQDMVKQTVSGDTGPARKNGGAERRQETTSKVQQTAVGDAVGGMDPSTGFMGYAKYIRHNELVGAAPDFTEADFPRMGSSLKSKQKERRQEIPVVPSSYRESSRSLKSPQVVDKKVKEARFNGTTKKNVNTQVADSKTAAVAPDCRNNKSGATKKNSQHKRKVGTICDEDDDNEPLIRYSSPKDAEEVLKNWGPDDEGLMGFARFLRPLEPKEETVVESKQEGLSKPKTERQSVDGQNRKHLLIQNNDTDNNSIGIKKDDNLNGCRLRHESDGVADMVKPNSSKGANQETRSNDVAQSIRSCEDATSPASNALPPNDPDSTKESPSASEKVTLEEFEKILDKAGIKDVIDSSLRAKLLEIYVRSSAVERESLPGLYRNAAIASFMLRNNYERNDCYSKENRDPNRKKRRDHDVGDAEIRNLLNNLILDLEALGFKALDNDDDLRLCKGTLCCGSSRSSEDWRRRGCLNGSRCRKSCSSDSRSFDSKSNLRGNSPSSLYTFNQRPWPCCSRTSPPDCQSFHAFNNDILRMSGDCAHLMVNTIGDSLFDHFNQLQREVDWLGSRTSPDNHETNVRVGSAGSQSPPAFDNNTRRKSGDSANSMVNTNDNNFNQRQPGKGMTNLTGSRMSPDDLKTSLRMNSACGQSDAFDNDTRRKSGDSTCLMVNMNGGTTLYDNCNQSQPGKGMANLTGSRMSPDDLKTSARMSSAGGQSPHASDNDTRRKSGNTAHSMVNTNGDPLYNNFNQHHPGKGVANLSESKTTAEEYFDRVREKLTRSPSHSFNQLSEKGLPRPASRTSDENERAKSTSPPQAIKRGTVRSGSRTPDSSGSKSTSPLYTWSETNSPPRNQSYDINPRKIPGLHLVEVKRTGISRTARNTAPKPSGLKFVDRIDNVVGSSTNDFMPFSSSTKSTFKPITKSSFSSDSTDVSSLHTSSCLNSSSTATEIDINPRKIPSLRLSEVSPTYKSRSSDSSGSSPPLIRARKACGSMSPETVNVNRSLNHVHEWLDNGVYKADVGKMVLSPGRRVMSTKDAFDFLTSDDAFIYKNHQ